MSTTIEKVTIGTEEGRIVLKNSQIARTLSVGSTWNHLRLGIRVAIKDWGDTTLNSSNWYFGVMASPPGGDLSYGPMSSQCPHFFGVFPGAGTDWTRGITTVAHYNIAALRTIKIIGASRTATASPNSDLYVPVTTADRRVVFILDIVRAAPNLTAALCLTNISAPPNWATDIPAAGLVAAMNGTSAINNVRDILHTYSGGTGYVGVAATGSIAVDEGTNGPFTTVVLAHGSKNCPLHVSDFYWRVVA